MRTTPQIEVTPAAAEQIRAALATQQPGMALRVAARHGAGGEIEYGMGLDERREQDEEVVTASGVTLLVSPPSLEPIGGTVIDFVEIEPGQMRFVFYRAAQQGPAQPGGDATGP